MIPAAVLSGVLQGHLLEFFLGGSVIVPEDQLFETHHWLISLLGITIFVIIIITFVIVFCSPNITNTTASIRYRSRILLC